MYHFNSQFKFLYQKKVLIFQNYKFQKKVQNFFLEDDTLSSTGSSISEDNNLTEVWNEFYELLETTLTQNSTQKLTSEQAREIINDFNRRRSSILANTDKKVLFSSISDMSSCSSVNLI